MYIGDEVLWKNVKLLFIIATMVNFNNKYSIYLIRISLFKKYLPTSGTARNIPALRGVGAAGPVGGLAARRLPVLLTHQRTERRQRVPVDGLKRSSS